VNEDTKISSLATLRYIFKILSVKIGTYLTFCSLCGFDFVYSWLFNAEDVILAFRISEN